jgi:hypothetical protein
VFDGQCMCINACSWIHVHLKPWHSGWWSVYVYHYLFINSRTFKTLTQSSMVSVCVSILVDQFLHISNLDTVVGDQCMYINDCLWIHVHLIPWQSVRWSVYVYQYVLMNSRTFKTLTQCSIVSVCVYILVYEFTYI